MKQNYFNRHKVVAKRKNKNTSNSKVNNEDLGWCKRWEKTRNLGILKYVIKYGVLMWGLTTSVIFQIILFVMNGFKITNLLAQLINPTLSLMVAGIFFGLTTYYSSESKYKKISSLSNQKNKKWIDLN